MFQRWMRFDKAKSALIIGPRRSGKTTYLKQTFPDYTYITLDDFDMIHWAERDPKGMIASLNHKSIIDEIQRVPSLTIAVKYAIDQYHDHIIMTGSSSIGLLDTSADTLAGRINRYSMPTACWGEDIAPPQHRIFTEKAEYLLLKEASRSYNEALIYGSFPEVLMKKSQSEKIELLNNYKNTYFTKDIQQLSNIENLDGLRAIYGNIAQSIGTNLEISHFAKESGLSVPTAQKYLNTLYQSELTFKLYGYKEGPAKRYIKSGKTYYADNGIIEAFRFRLSEGQLLENFVISELEKRRKLGFIKAEQFYYYKSSGGREIDLIFEAEETVHVIEIKAIKTPTSRDVANIKAFLSSIKRKSKGFLFYLGENYLEIDDIACIPVFALYGGI